ncbi:MAG TPA: cytochrome c [Rhodanobacteraceae bacterium]|nr:cytochrome c [Rhodanobacteraceae bacterium]
MRRWLLMLVFVLPMAAAQSLPTPASTRAADVVQGEYLARIGDCVACHTARGGKPLAGGRAIATPFGSIYAPNITPDVETGIGSWQRQDFRHAMHNGIGRGGNLLYPAFPFPSFTRVSDADVDAIYAWLRTVPAVHNENTAPDLRWPYSLRPLLMVWRGLYFQPGVYRPDPSRGAQWNRGAYLVEGLGHCNGCHTPRNGLGAIQASQALAGAMMPVENWYAPDLRPGAGGSLDGWSVADIAGFLQSGVSRHGNAFGPMAEVVQRSLQYLSDADAHAIGVYLLDPPPRAPVTPTPPGLVAPPSQARNLFDEGETIYRQNCADCHGDDGQGAGLIYPALAGNRGLLGPDVNAIRAVLLGGFTPSTRANPRPYSMPPFAPVLSDREVAAVVTFIRRSWGNQGSAVAPASVARNRSVPPR